MTATKGTEPKGMITVSRQPIQRAFDIVLEAGLVLDGVSELLNEIAPELAEYTGTADIIKKLAVLNAAAIGLKGDLKTASDLIEEQI